MRAGDASAEILAEARSLPADLIVISTHGRSGVTHLILGSVTEHVVRSAPCPVLVFTLPPLGELLPHVAARELTFFVCGTDSQPSHYGACHNRND